MANIGLDLTKQEIENAVNFVNDNETELEHALDVVEGSDFGSSVDEAGHHLNTALGYGSNATGDNSTALGRQSEAVGRYSVAIGYDAETTNTNDIAIGAGARANLGIAIGAGANATALGAIQIDEGTNNSSETVKIKNTTIMDETGKIPYSALQGGEVVGIAVNSSNHLIVTYASGTTEDLGAIGGGGCKIQYLPEEFHNYSTLDEMFEAGLPSGIYTVLEGNDFGFSVSFDSDSHTINANSIFIFNSEMGKAALFGGINDFIYDGMNFQYGNIVTENRIMALYGIPDTTPTSGSTNVIESGAVYTAIQNSVGGIETALQGLISGGGVS